MPVKVNLWPLGKVNNWATNTNKARMAKTQASTDVAWIVWRYSAAAKRRKKTEAPSYWAVEKETGAALPCQYPDPNQNYEDGLRLKEMLRTAWLSAELVQMLINISICISIPNNLRSSHIKSSLRQLSGENVKTNITSSSPSSIDSPSG